MSRRVALKGLKSFFDEGPRWTAAIVAGSLIGTLTRAFSDSGWWSIWVGLAVAITVGIGVGLAGRLLMRLKDSIK